MLERWVHHAFNSLRWCVRSVVRSYYIELFLLVLSKEKNEQLIESCTAMVVENRQHAIIKARSLTHTHPKNQR